MTCFQLVSVEIGKMNKENHQKPEMMEKNTEKEEKCDNNLTISTKLSTDQLICKTPRESPNASVKSIKQNVIKKCKQPRKPNPFLFVLYLGILQIFLGLLMCVFGVLVITYKSSSSHVSIALIFLIS